MLQVMVLVCSLQVTPNLADCNRDSAVSVMFAESSRTNEMCGLLGQVTVAHNPDLIGPDEVLKVVCSHRSIVH